MKAKKHGKTSSQGASLIESVAHTIGSALGTMASKTGLKTKPARRRKPAKKSTTARSASRSKGGSKKKQA